MTAQPGRGARPLRSPTASQTASGSHGFREACCFLPIGSAGRTKNPGGGTLHNVRVKQIDQTRAKAEADPQAAVLAVNLDGAWRSDEGQPQFAGTVVFPQGEVVFEADFPPFLGGEGRAPTPLAYCFYGAMCCYGATFATQAAVAGVALKDLRINLQLDVDFRTALGLGTFPPISEFRFLVEVDTDASDDDVQRVKQLADERCPAIWAMDNRVPYTTTANVPYSTIVSWHNRMLIRRRPPRHCCSSPG